LEKALRGSARGDYIYEDYVPGFGLTSSAGPGPGVTDTSQQEFTVSVPSSSNCTVVIDLTQDSDEELGAGDEDENGAFDSEDSLSEESFSGTCDFELEAEAAPVEDIPDSPPKKMSRVEWNYRFSESEDEAQ
jgi:hypothetical protein